MESIVVITSNLNGFSLSNYAYNFYDYNDFGIGSSYDGVLFLIDMDKIREGVKKYFYRNIFAHLQLTFHIFLHITVVHLSYIIF